MKTTMMLVVALLVVVVAMQRGALGSPVTGPAFLWTPQMQRSSQSSAKEVVDYHTISSKDLAKSLLTEGRWSSVLCSGENVNDDVEVALVFLGRKLSSLDISSSKLLDPALLQMLKLSFTTSDVSMAFPYVSVLDEKEGKLGASLISSFGESCANGLGLNSIAHIDISSSNGTSLNDFMAKRTAGKKDLIVLENGNSDKLEGVQTEGEVLLDVVDTLKQSGVKYTILYASNPHKSIEYPGHLALRHLAEDNESIASAYSKNCDGVCKLKSTLIEGLFVAIVLLVILISGLCCMAGIDTPTRFEAPQES